MDAITGALQTEFPLLEKEKAAGIERVEELKAKKIEEAAFEEMVSKAVKEDFSFSTDLHNVVLNLSFGNSKNALISLKQICENIEKHKYTNYTAPYAEQRKTVENESHAMDAPRSLFYTVETLLGRIEAFAEKVKDSETHNYYITQHTEGLSVADLAGQLVNHVNFIRENIVAKPLHTLESNQSESDSDDDGFILIKGMENLSCKNLDLI